MDLLERLEALPEIPDVEEVAKILGVTSMNIRIGLQRGIYPFGVAMDMGEKGRYTYTIFKRRLIKYVNGELWLAKEGEKQPIGAIKEEFERMLNEAKEQVLDDIRAITRVKSRRERA